VGKEKCKGGRDKRKKEYKKGQISGRITGVRERKKN